MIRDYGLDFPDDVPFYLFAQGCGRQILEKYRDKEGEFSLSEILSANPSMRQEIIDEHLGITERYFSLIKSFIPKSTERLLDIGCGLGLLDLVILKEINKDIEIVLFDKEMAKSDLDSELPPAGYHESSSTYDFVSSLMLAEELLVSNLKKPNVKLVDASPKNLKSLKNVDLVVSKRSWGFHYPVETYIKEVHSVLASNGRVIFDTRKNSANLKLIQKYFCIVDIAELGKKHYTLVLEKRKAGIFR